MMGSIDRVCQALRESGIDIVFGVPGTQNVALFEGFRRNGLRTVLTTHELAASFMANGYYRASGRVAALATIPGPGFTYALTGLAEAKLDSVPIVYLVGVPTREPGRRFQLQALDQVAMASPVVKGILTLTASSDTAGVIADALALALDGEPGPVMVQIDLRHDSADGLRDTLVPTVTSGASRERLFENIDKLATLFRDARRPLLYLGAGAFESASRIEALATTHHIPILTTPTARGVVREDSPIAMGFDPLRGHVAEANALLDRSDLTLVLGCKLGHNGSAGFGLHFAPEKLVHVDASPDVVGANYEPLVPIVARVETVIPRLESRSQASDWTLEELAAARAAFRSKTGDGREPVIGGPSLVTPAEFFALLREVLPDDAILVTDSGQHQILARRHFEVRSPRGMIVPSDFQSMGFGLPAAIGAAMSGTDRPVIALIGDGGFLMSGLELLTARREGVPLLTFVFNDGYLNQIRMQQLREFGQAHAVMFHEPRFDALAEAFDIDYVRFDPTATEPIRTALTASRPTLVEVVVSDSLAIQSIPWVARTKNVARAVLRPGLRRLIRAALRGSG